MTQQVENHSQLQTQSQPEPARSVTPLPPALHLPSETVRTLVASLTEAEDMLRDLEPFVLRNGRLVVNPARQPWIARERALVAELRSRRITGRRGRLPGLP